MPGPAEIIAAAETAVDEEHVAAALSALPDVLRQLEGDVAAAEGRGWLMRALAAQARLALTAGDVAQAGAAVERLDALSRGGQDRWFAATTRLLECELWLLQGDATRAARGLDGLARWIAARPEAPAGLARAIAASRVVAHVASGDISVLRDAIDALEQLAPGSPLAALGRGFVAESAGDPDEARARYAAAAAGPAACALEAHLGLARLDPDGADHLAAATAIAGAGNPRVLAARARAELSAGRYAQARALAARLARTPGAEPLLVCAEIACATASRAEARTRVALLGLWAREHGAVTLEASAYLLAARVADDPIERATSIRLARETATGLGDALLLLRARLEQAMLELDLGHPAEALATALELEAAARAHGRADLVAAAALALGLAAQALGKRDAAMHLGRAGRLAVQHGQINLAARALDALGRADEAAALRSDAGITA